ncbi:MAG: hypothetical protein V7L26_17520 [Nostoc sp.]|uniref:hypothetical protein n=1 Tax=Nostoc sp. TaxID=1180 RepID=UPI002FF74EF6
MSKDHPEEKAKGKGGFRPGAGRKYKGVLTKKLKINAGVLTKLRSHVDWLVITSGKYISLQEYASNAVLKSTNSCSKNINFILELANDVSPSTDPWETITITEKAYNELADLVEKTRPHTPVYTNLSNVFTVILLKEIVLQKKLLS